MRVLVACEESQEVTKAFRAKGHDAWSLDIIDCSGGHPEWHIKKDVVKHLLSVPYKYYDLIIIHIPCTKVAVSGNRWYGVGMLRHSERIEYIKWARYVWSLVRKKSKACALENPVSVLFKELVFDLMYYIQPWQFGHGEQKKTGLGTFNLPKLQPTNIVEGREQRRAKERSKTYPGIAQAMADQWG